MRARGATCAGSAARPTAPDDPKVLMVAPMSGHYATLLRGTVKPFLPDHEVYVTEWRDAREVPISGRPASTSTTTSTSHQPTCRSRPRHPRARGLPAVGRRWWRRFRSWTRPTTRPRPKHHLSAARWTPARASRGERPGQAAQPRLVPPQRHPPPCRIGYPGAMRKVYPGFLQLAGFMAMNLNRHVEAHWADVPASRPRATARPWPRSEAFLRGIPAPSWTSRPSSTCRPSTRVFQVHSLPQGLLKHRGHRVNPVGDHPHRGPDHRRRARRHLRHRPDKSDAHHHPPSVRRPGASSTTSSKASAITVLFNGQQFRAEIAPRIKGFIRAQRREPLGVGPAERIRAVA